MFKPQNLHLYMLKLLIFCLRVQFELKTCLSLIPRFLFNFTLDNDGDKIQYFLLKLSIKIA